MRKFASGAIAFAALVAALPVMAQEIRLPGEEAVQPVSPEEAILRQRADDVLAVMAGEKAYTDVFGSAFVNAVSEDQFRELNDQMTGQFGPIVGVEDLVMEGPQRATFKIRFERALGTTIMVVSGDEPHLIDGLRVTSFTPVADTAEDVATAVETLHGQSNALLARISPEGRIEPVFAVNPDERLALGSTFKLYVLSALAKSVHSGALRWDQVVKLNERSLPSGMMQDWPVGAPVTVQTLATMMISISDNTATDRLIALLGRKAIEEEVAASGHRDPSVNYPFLTTAEMFALKLQGESVTSSYAAANERGRRSILQGLSTAGLSTEKANEVFAAGPRALDVEWFASPRELGTLLARLLSWKDPTILEVLGVNPSLPADERQKWSYVGYKGGSEPGVLNLTWLLKSRGGDYYIATLGWNDPAKEVDHKELELLSARMIALAR